MSWERVPWRIYCRKRYVVLEIALSLPTHENLTDANGEAVTSKQYASLGSVHTLLANIYAWMGGLYGETSYWENSPKAMLRR